MERRFQEMIVSNSHLGGSLKRGNSSRAGPEGRANQTANWFISCPIVAMNGR
jgi:hypothetical protein